MVCSSVLNFPNSFSFAFFSEKELAREEVIALQDTKSRLSQHISEIEQELKRSEPIPCFEM